jgi:hypothetical protein
MIRKLVWLFVIYIVLRTVAPDVAALVVGIAIASVVTAINLVGEAIATVVAQVSVGELFNGGFSIAITAVILLVLRMW